jgi:hypothetical protein
MSAFSSTTAKILYAMLLGAVIYSGFAQRMAKSSPQSLLPPSVTNSWK